MKYEDLAPELMEKAKACKTKEEFLEFAEKNFIELSDEELAALSGGRNLPFAVICPMRYDGHCPKLDDSVI